MKLHEFARAPNPRRVRMFLAEKGLDDEVAGIERVPVDMFGGEHKTPEFLAKSPLAQLPVLELDDGTFVTETMAICRYFEALHSSPSLFGQDAQNVAVIEMWNRRMEFGVFLPAIMLLRLTNPMLAKLQKQDPDHAAEQRQLLEEGLGFLDGELAGREFISPTGFSVADITAFAGLDFTLHGDFEIAPSFENVSRWYKAIKARPSASA